MLLLIKRLISLPDSLIEKRLPAKSSAESNMKNDYKLCSDKDLNKFGKLCIIDYIPMILLSMGKSVAMRYWASVKRRRICFSSRSAPLLRSYQARTLLSSDSCLCTGYVFDQIRSDSRLLLDLSCNLI